MSATTTAAVLKARQALATEHAAERLILHMPRSVWRAYMAALDPRDPDPRAAAAILIAWIVRAEIEMEEALDTLEFGEITQ